MAKGGTVIWSELLRRVQWGRRVNGVQKHNKWGSTVVEGDLCQIETQSRTVDQRTRTERRVGLRGHKD